MGFFYRAYDGGYIVMHYCTDKEYDRHVPVMNFGDRQSDAIEFCRDCNRGIVPESRVRMMEKAYAKEKTYEYRGKGFWRINREERQK